MAAIQGIEWHQRAITPVQLNFPNREQEPLDSLTTISYSNPCREISFQKEEVSIDQHFYFGFWLIFYINSETNIVALEIIFFLSLILGAPWVAGKKLNKMFILEVVKYQLSLTDRMLTEF